jgi:hypothetical protein
MSVAGSGTAVTTLAIPMALGGELPAYISAQGKVLIPRPLHAESLRRNIDDRELPAQPTKCAGCGR